MADLDDNNLDVDMDNVGVNSWLEDSADDVDATYRVPLLKMKAHFKLVDVIVGAREITVKRGSDEKETRSEVKFVTEITEIVKVAPGQKNVPENLEEAFVGRRLVESITKIGDMSDKQFLGQIKAFITDMMGKGFSGTWNELFEEAKGAEFAAEIKMRPNKVDPERPYPYIARDTKGAIVAL